MTYRYLMLSDKSRLDATASIWVVNHYTVRIPEEELDCLCIVDKEFRDPDSPLKSVFSDLEYTVEIDGEESAIDSEMTRKEEWIAALEQFQQWILHLDQDLWGLMKNPPELDYSNEEYARMIAAILQIVQESVRLDEPIEHWLGK